MLSSHTLRSVRGMTSAMSTYLKYSEYGDPKQVVKHYQEPLADPKDSQVLLKMLVAPINPADINTIQGV